MITDDIWTCLCCMSDFDMERPMHRDPDTNEPRCLQCLEAEQEPNRIDAFLKELDARTLPNPILPAELIYRSIVGLEVWKRTSCVYLLRFRALTPGKGHGTIGLKFLGELADKYRVRIMLTACPDPYVKNGLSLRELREWYIRNGYRRVKPRDPARLIRIPKGQS